MKSSITCYNTSIQYHWRSIFLACYINRNISSTAKVSNHTYMFVENVSSSAHYPGTYANPAAKSCGKQLWSSEDYSTKNDEIGQVRKKWWVTKKSFNNNVTPCSTDIKLACGAAPPHWGAHKTHKPSPSFCAHFEFLFCFG